MAEAARNSAVTRDRDSGFDLSEEDEVDDAISAGTIIADRYRVLSTLGAGGMGSVYLAEHLTVGRTVAIKVLSSEWSGKSFVTRRFQAEARIASAIGHPNIVEVFDAGQLPDHRLFLVMEHLEGRDLGDELDERGALSQQRTALIIRQVALALAAAHNVGVIHRDLKPGNVMIARRADDEVVKILDFGIASSPRATAREGQRLTRPGAIMGTPDYMAPEQATSAEPTPRFDVYALGAMTFEMLVGEPPLAAETPFELMVCKRQTPSPSLATRAPHVHPEFVALVDDCLKIHPSERPRDAAEFLDRLDTFIDALPDDDDEIAVPRTTLVAPVPTADGGPPGLANRSSLRVPPPPGVPTLPTGPRPVDAARRAALALLVGVLALGLGGWLYLATTDRSTQLPFAEAAIPGDPVEEPALTTPPVVPAVTPPAPQDPPLAPVEPAPAPAPDAEAGAPEPPPAAEPPPNPSASPAVSAPRPGKREFTTNECARLRARAEEARRAQSWGLLRELSRRRGCWPSDAEARKLQTKALMELGDFSGCVAAGHGLDDKEVVQWRKLCQRRAG